MNIRRHSVQKQSTRLTRSLISAASAVLLAATAGAEDLQESVMIRESPGTATVLQRHLDAFAARDLDAVMSDYTEQSVFITPAGVLRGKTEIRRLFETLIREFSSPGTVLAIHRRFSEGPVAYITWTAQTPGRRYEMATDTLYIVDGRIRYQTFAAKTAAE